jgi:hypothetical protein
MNKFKMFEVSIWPEFPLKSLAGNVIKVNVCAENEQDALRLAQFERGYKIAEIREIEKRKFKRETVTRITKCQTLALHAKFKGD